MKKEPRLPWSEDKFHTPLIYYTLDMYLEAICVLLWISAHWVAEWVRRREQWSLSISGHDTSGKSRKLCLILTCCMYIFNNLNYLCTAWMVVKRRGEFFTRLVKMNSNLEVNLADMQSACVCPRSFDFALRMFIFVIQVIPMPNRIRYDLTRVSYFTEIDFGIVVWNPQHSQVCHNKRSTLPIISWAK